MAGISLKPPEPFEFEAPDDWTHWWGRFEQFRVASGLAEKDAKTQIQTLLYCMGEQSEAILKTTKPSEDDLKDYDKILGKFNEYYAVRKNVIYERARFNRRNQLPGETADQYIMALHTLAANCDYRDMEEDFIRDCLVVGIRDLGLSKTLQLEATLDLEKAKKAIHQRESVQQQLQLQQQDASSTALEAIQPTNRRKQQQQGLRNRIRCGRGLADNSKHCTRCGKEPHSRDKCPAKDAICNWCQKKGHYGAQCLTKHKKASVDSTSGLDTAFLDSTTNETSNESAWFTNIRVGEHMVKFKMDTGAEVTAISRQTYEALPKQPPLNTSDKTLCGPAKKPLQVAGQCQLLLNHMGKSSPQEVFVVDAGKKTLKTAHRTVVHFSISRKFLESLSKAAILSVFFKEKQDNTSLQWSFHGQ